MIPAGGVSVIIPTFNSWKTLRVCLKSIFNQSLEPLEVIVVDNASTDETVAQLKKNFPKVKLVNLTKNTGVTGGRNAGIKNSSLKSDYLLFFDHDMVADKEMIKELIEVSSFEKKCGIVTPKIYYLKDKKRIWAAGTNINLWTGQVLFRGGKDTGQYDCVEEVQVAPAAFLVKRLILKKVKGFDNRFFATYEDTDFCFRSKKQGFETLYSPKAIAYHDISPRKKDERERLLGRAYYIGRNRILFMKDHARSFLIFLLFSLIYLLYFLKLGIEERNIKGIKEYFRGYLVGLIESMYSLRLKTYK